MNRREKEIANGLRELARDAVKEAIVPATVISVKGDSCTCEVDGLEYEDVRLRALVDGEPGLLITPEDNSHVMLGRIGDSNQFFVIGFSKIKSISIGGKDNGGMIISAKLVEQMGKLTKRVDGIIDAINNGVPAAGAPDGGAGLHTSIKLGLATLTDKENFGDIENKKVVH